MEETVKEGTHEGIPYSIIRTDEYDPVGGYEFRFVGRIRGLDIITASELEDRDSGYSKPWVPTIEKYLQAHIDGALYAQEI